jgi:hypothetical protein
MKAMRELGPDGKVGDGLAHLQEGRERRQAGIASSPLLAKVQATIARLNGAYATPEDIDTTKDDAELEAMSAQIANPPSDGDIAALALIGRWFTAGSDGRMPQLRDGDIIERSTARLIEAVLRWARLDPTTATGRPGGAPELLPRQTEAHQLLAAWREASRANVAAMEPHNEAVPGSLGFGDLERASEAARERLVQLADEVWRTPAVGWPDIFLRNEIAVDLLCPNYYGQCQERLEAMLAGGSHEYGTDISGIASRAVAQLVKAIRAIGEAGPVGHVAEAHQPKRPFAVHLETPIARTAQEIAALDEVYDAADEAQTCKERQPAAKAQDFDFAAIRKTAHERCDALKHLLVTLEPESLDDTLSLVLALTGEFGEIVDNHLYHDAENPTISRETEQLVARIERTFSAIIRGMLRHGGACSPLLDRFTVPADHLTWVETATAVVAEANRLRKESDQPA